MQFLFQPLTWGFLLIGVPILVHLINMLRHRKQRWAAMDFLLESYRRNRRWVLLKQWLLLATRMLVMFLLVAMLAKWVSSSEWMSWIGGRTTHHYILLDDSFSMSETDQNKSAYDRALDALGGLVRSISAQPGQHQVTLVRWSRAELAKRSGESGQRIDSAADLIAQSVPRDPSRLLERLNASSPVAMQLRPEPAIELLAASLRGATEEQAHVYLLTDVRQNEFGDPKELKNQLQTLVRNDAKLHVIDCGRGTSANMSLVSLEPEQEVWAAGVPLMVRMQVRNQSQQVKNNLVVKVRTVDYPEGVTQPQLDQPYSGQITELPPVVIEQLQPGETVTRRVQVVFGAAGSHVVEASLPDDAIATDNRRWCTIGIQPSQRVLLVDGDVEQTNAFFFEKLIEPGAKLRTGMSLEKVDASYLRDTSLDRLMQFDVVAMLDVPRIDQQAIAKLEEFSAAGGGVFFLCGENTNLRFTNEEMHRDGEGLFPVRIDEILDLPAWDDNREPRVSAEEHPVLAPLTQLESSPFFSVRIRRLLSVTPESLEEGAVEVIARARQGRPLLVEGGFGDGRVIVLLTGLSSEWSNWAQDPTFVVMSLRTLGYLGSFRREPTSFPVATPLEMVVMDQTVLPEADIVFPWRGEGVRTRVQREVQQSEDELLARVRMDVDLPELDRGLIDNLLRPGIFEGWIVNGQGETVNRNFARNVNAAEGDLTQVTRSELQQKLPGIPFEWKTADSLSDVGLSAQDVSHSTLLMALLAALLIGEQLLAYSASYHAPRRPSVLGASSSHPSLREGSHRSVSAQPSGAVSQANSYGTGGGS